VSMVVTCVPGVRGVDVRDALQRVLNDLVNLGSGPGPRENSLEWVAAYLSWASDSAQRLRHLISADTIDELVLTRRYELVLGSLGAAGFSQLRRVFNGLLATEIDHRVSALTSAVEWLDARLRTWSSVDVFVAVDTSFICNAEKPLEKIDFAELLDVREKHIPVGAPMVVVDELDRLKEHRSRDRDNVRWRVSHALAVLDDRCQDPTRPGVLHPADASALQTGGIPRGPVSIEILADPLRHTPLPVADDEIVARVKSWEPLTPTGQITLLTFDTGQATRARQAQLDVRKFDKPSKQQSDGSDAKTASKTRGKTP
jgi:PIN domain-containing protein